jgi:hypothetical protein
MVMCDADNVDEIGIIEGSVIRNHKRAGGLCIKIGMLIVLAGEMARDNFGVFGVRHVGNNSFSSVISHTLSV